MIMDLFLLESIAELVAFVAVVCCPVGADGKNGGGGPSPFPGALPRAFTSHTFGVLLPSRWALGMNDEPETRGVAPGYRMAQLGSVPAIFLALGTPADRRRTPLLGRLGVCNALS